MLVRMYMSGEVVSVAPETTLSKAIQVMRKGRIRRLVVATGETLMGIVSERDLVNAFPHHVNPFSPLLPEMEVSHEPIRSIMRRPVITIDENEPIEHAAQLMANQHIGGLVATRHGKLAGIITESDIFRAFTRLLAGSGRSIRITFDITDNENLLSFLARSIPKHGLNLLSFISFHKGGAGVAVARVRGKKFQAFINEIWASGHQVMSIVRYEDELDFKGAGMEKTE